jgi:hypothetical protein
VAKKTGQTPSKHGSSISSVSQQWLFPYRVRPTSSPRVEGRNELCTHTLIHLPADVITVAVCCYLCYGFSQDVEKLLAERGITGKHVSVYGGLSGLPRCSFAARLRPGIGCRRDIVTVLPTMVSVPSDHAIRQQHTMRVSARGWGSLCRCKCRGEVVPREVTSLTPPGPQHRSDPARSPGVHANSAPRTRRVGMARGRCSSPCW